MSRHPIVVREASPHDAGELLELWTETVGTPEDVPGEIGGEYAESALNRITTSPDEHLLVGDYHGRVVAAMHLRQATFSPIHAQRVLHTSFLMVRPEFRRHGYAHALLEAAVVWAEEHGITHVSAASASGSRETNRFLARLGLSTVATLRVASTGTLRKKVAPERGLRSSGRPVGNRHVLALRRTMRRHESAAGGSWSRPGQDSV